LCAAFYKNPTIYPAAKWVSTGFKVAKVEEIREEKHPTSIQLHNCW